MSVAYDKFMSYVNKTKAIMQNIEGLSKQISNIVLEIENIKKMLMSVETFIKIFNNI